MGKDYFAEADVYRSSLSYKPKGAKCRHERDPKSQLREVRKNLASR